MLFGYEKQNKSQNNTYLFLKVNNPIIYTKILLTPLLTLASK